MGPLFLTPDEMSKRPADDEEQSEEEPAEAPKAAEEEEEPEIVTAQGPGRKVKARRTCPYLGTINRHLLDFDFEKICCISLNSSLVRSPRILCGYSTKAPTHILRRPSRNRAQ